MYEIGEPIHGELHSIDASAGVLVPLLIAGTRTVRTLKANEFIEIYSLELVSAVGGDTSLFIETNSTPLQGDYIIRATLAANSGIVMSRMRFTGMNNASVYLLAPTGVVDINFRGAVRSTTQVGRQTWQSKLNPGGLS